jgi:single-strand DNA-binding protein
MASYNKVILIGNLTRDPELRYTPSGSAVCDIGLAVNRRFLVAGQEKEEACFIDIVVWAKQAESCGKYLQKGSPVLIEGHLKNDNWEDKDGKKKTRMRVVAERVQFLGGKRDDSKKVTQQYYAPDQQQPTAERNTGFTQEANRQEQMPMPPPEAFDSVEEVEDDIPF